MSKTEIGQSIVRRDDGSTFEGAAMGLALLETLTHNLAGFFTFGCNLPLFRLAYNPIVSITFPDRAFENK